MKNETARLRCEMSSARIALCATVSVVSFLIAGSAEGADGPEMNASMQRLLGAAEVTQQYVRPLGLEGKSVRTAMDALLSRGFSCGVKEGAPKGMPPPFDNQSAVLNCAKENAHLNDKCADVALTVVPKKVADPIAASSLLDKVDEAVVDGVYASCPEKVTVSERRIQQLAKARAAAAGELRVRIDSLKLEGAASYDAFKELVDQKYDCALLPRAGDKSMSRGTMLVCSSWRSGIADCVTAKVALKLKADRSKRDLEPTALIRASKVQSVSSECELPATEEL